jgi:hypothetical protein
MVVMFSENVNATALDFKCTGIKTLTKQGLSKKTEENLSIMHYRF